MNDIICNHCKKQVTPGTEHHCEEMKRAGLLSKTVPNNPDQEDDDCFITSAVIGYATSSSFAGTIAGGNPVGAAAGAALSQEDEGDQGDGVENTENAAPNDEAESDMPEDTDEDVESDDNHDEDPDDDD